MQIALGQSDICEFESYMPSHAVRSLWGGSQPLQHAGWPMRSRAIAWNGFAERLIGSIRRECVDHLVVLGEAHLRWILTKYATYYNELRTHRSLNKDAPIRRAIQHVGRIVSAPVLGGLHHHYCRIQFSVHTARARETPPFFCSGGASFLAAQF